MMMVTETNRYAEHCLKSKPSNSQTPKKKKSAWKPTTGSEMKNFLGILMIMGVVHVPDIRLHWSKKDLYSNELIKKTMSRDRFLDLLKFWHLCNNENADKNDRLNKIRPLLNKANKNFHDSESWKNCCY